MQGPVVHGEERQQDQRLFVSMCFRDVNEKLQGQMRVRKRMCCVLYIRTRKRSPRSCARTMRFSSAYDFPIPTTKKVSMTTTRDIGASVVSHRINSV